jgi:hypothetical protein
LRGNAFQENALWAIIEEAHMPLSPEQEALCDHLEKGMPSAAALIRQQAREIDDLWDRLSHAYALVRHESPAEMIQEEMEALRAMLEERQRSFFYPAGARGLSKSGPAFMGRHPPVRRPWTDGAPTFNVTS